MLTWPFQLVILGLLVLVAIAQWLDWQAGIQHLTEVKSHQSDRFH
jgi:hypothetical protein